MVYGMLGFCVANPLFAGGGWVRKPSSFYAKLGYATLRSDKFFSIGGQSVTTSPFSLQSLNFYAEYGLPLGSIGVEGVEAMVNFPLYRRSSFETTEAVSSLGDLMIELKYALLKGDFPVALGVAAEFPTGDENAIARDKDFPEAFIALPLGDGEFNIWTKIYASHSFYPVNAYVSVDMGYNFRTEGFTNQYQFGAEIGYKFLNAIWVVGKLRRFAGVGAPNEDLFGGFGLGEGVEYTANAVELAYQPFNHVWVTAEYASAFGGLRNIYSGANLTLGAAVEF